MILVIPVQATDDGGGMLLLCDQGYMCACDYSLLHRPHDQTLLYTMFACIVQGDIHTIFQGHHVQGP